MTVPALPEQYSDHLLPQWEFRDYHGAKGEPDVRPWNRLARKIEIFHRALKSHGDEGVDAILTLIDHPNRNVRYGASVARWGQVLPCGKETNQDATQWQRYTAR